MTKIDYATASLGDEALDGAFEYELRALRRSESPVERNLIGGVWYHGPQIVERFDPCAPDSRVGAAFIADDTQVDAAVQAARTAAKAWRSTPFRERNELILRGRADFENDFTRIAAIVSAETGKSRLEAYGEAQEVLDMVTHYTSLFASHDGYRVQQKSTDAEANFDLLVPYGTFAVISPFNFPVALATGMTIAALVTGNTVVLKPSDKTPRSTAVMAETFARHLPAGVYNVVHGGADVGRRLAEGDVDGIAFTGSADVGWQLFDAVGPRGYRRPVLAEMGGQNPAIVAASADLDSAASGIVRSAFGLSGQKCSACRRVVVHESVADELIAKLVDLSEQLVVGDPVERASDLGPVIDDAIARRVDEALETAAADGRIVTGGKDPDRDGNFYRPIIVTDLAEGHPLTRKELFAPFLTVTRVTDFDAALVEANAVDFGLSAGIFSQVAEEVDRFFDEIEAGVLYSNRTAGATTGAWPGVQSFCGWKRSGTVGKGGLGVHYLQGFLREQNRTIVGMK